MYTRAVENTLKSEKANEFTKTLKERIIPVLLSQTGFVDVNDIAFGYPTESGRRLSFWRTKEEAERYHREQSQRVSNILSYFVENEPVVQTFNVETSTLHKIEVGKAA